MSNNAAAPSAPQSGRRGPRKPPRPVEVARVENLSPHMVRITVTGEALADWPEGDPTGHCKVFLPAEGETEPALPEMGPDGLVYPKDRPRPVVRTYTPRRIDRDAKELVLDFVLHGHGEASTWAQSAKPGMKLAVGGVGRGYVIDTDATKFHLAGDEAAIPALAVLLESLPTSAQITVDIEVRGEDAHIVMPEHPNARLQWHTLAAAEQPGSTLINALADVAPDDQLRIWVATEAKAVRTIRRAFLDRGMPVENLVTRGYWKLGESNHPDGDYATDA